MKFIKTYMKRKRSLILIVSGLLVAALFSATVKADDSVANATKNLPPNAYYYYLKALDVRRQASLTNHTPPPPPAPPPPLEPKPYHYEENPAEIKADAEALEIIRHGFAFKYEKAEEESSDVIYAGPDILFNSGMREVARMLSRESEAKAKRGDWAGAANSAMDGIRLGQDISHGTIIDMLVGRSIQAIASKSLYNVLDHADAAIAREVVTRLTKILSQKIQYADLLQAEKQNGLWFYGQLAATPDWREESHETSTKSLQDLKEEYLSAMDELAANARLPYPQRKKSIPAPADSVNQLLLALFSNPKYLNSGMAQGISLDIQQTKSAFILVEFALRAYQLEHHKYPQTLTELKPDYLQEIPNDPFSANQSLRYKTENNKYILYSIGPDAKDDGGKSIKERAIKVDSKGDILAGLRD